MRAYTAYLPQRAVVLKVLEDLSVGERNWILGQILMVRINSTL